MSKGELREIRQAIRGSKPKFRACACFILELMILPLLWTDESALTDSVGTLKEAPSPGEGTV